uniref:Uncharacterized protein n=1 Tax=Sphaerodactylus townsendi TaxID=933632 RepID=A0ACB8EYX4_9SAUR
MESSQLKRIQAWEQAETRGEGTQRGSQVREEEKHVQVDVVMRLLPKRPQATLQMRGAQTEGVTTQQERSQSPQGHHGLPLNRDAKQSRKPAHYLEVRLKIKDYRDTCKKQLFNLIACFFRLISGNLSSEGTFPVFSASGSTGRWCSLTLAGHQIGLTHLSKMFSLPQHPGLLRQASPVSRRGSDFPESGTLGDSFCGYGLERNVRLSSGD